MAMEEKFRVAAYFISYGPAQAATREIQFTHFALLITFSITQRGGSLEHFAGFGLLARRWCAALDEVAGNHIAIA